MGSHVRADDHLLTYAIHGLLKEVLLLAEDRQTKGGRLHRPISLRKSVG